MCRWKWFEESKNIAPSNSRNRIQRGRGAGRGAKKMAIYAKITIKEKKTKNKREYIALFNSGSSLKPISIDLRVLPISYIIVPTEVALELGIDLKRLPKKGKYYVHEGTYEVCIHDPDDEPITCLDIQYIFIEEGLDRILLPAEFLMNAKIKLDLETLSWECKGRKIKSIFEAKDIRKISKKLLRYTPYYDLV